MHHTTTLGNAGLSRPSTLASSRRVVDAPIRMFHALFALSFVGAYVTADGEHWRALHVTLGYAMAGLLCFRVLYGLFGPRHAGLGAMWRKLGSAPEWLRLSIRALRQLTPSGVNWRQGQNLLMALAVVALLALVMPLTFSGFATYQDWGDVLGSDWFEELHEFLGEAMLFVVITHLTLIAGLSWLRRRNQALAMLTGRVGGAGPDVVKRNRGWLAALLLLAVLAFGAWQWQQYPNGLLPGRADSSSFLHHKGHDDEDA